MSEAKRIVELMTDGTDMFAPTMLCALVEDSQMEVPAKDERSLRILARYGCVVCRQVTALCRQAAMVVRAKVLSEQRA